MKKVLIPLAIHKSKEDAVAMHFVRETYICKMTARGVWLEYLSALESKEVWKAKSESCDGVLLMGGGDVDPKYYGQSRHELTNVNELERDELELWVVRQALAEGKPILGICRGCQILNVGAKGNLVQDVPEKYARNHTVQSYEELGQVRHEVELEKGSLIHELVGKDVIVVNSGHHQSVDVVGEGLRVSGKSADKVVEIIESVDRGHFCLGIQCHPEFESGDLEVVFDEFVSRM
jgi:putative glutamine amidotransferase